jgi:galactose-1-phosphate uridylyltransferase
MEREDIENVKVEELAGLFRGDEGLAQNAPDSLCQIDPRDGSLVIYNSKRAKRPHDNEEQEKTRRQGTEEWSRKDPAESCPVCSGKTTGIVDVAELSEGYTFINKNLFPVIFPPEKVDPRWLREALYPDPSHLGRVAYGMHFLQWSSSYHYRDWQNMPLEDRVIVLKRLAALERSLLYNTEGFMPPSSQWRSQKETSGFVSIIKNYGAPVGGSLEHGHQQITWSNIMPRSYYNDWTFFSRHRDFFSDYLLRENPPEYLLKDYGEAVLLVPYFMQRPFKMMLIAGDVGKQYLCELGEGEIEAVAAGIGDAVRAILEIMPGLGKEPAYNMVVHNGPGAGIYFEFMPYTQETGGFEHLGMWICQSTPAQAVEILKEYIHRSS